MVGHHLGDEHLPGIERPLSRAPEVYLVSQSAWTGWLLKQHTPNLAELLRRKIAFSFIGVVGAHFCQAFRSTRKIFPAEERVSEGQWHLSFNRQMDKSCGWSLQHGDGAFCWRRLESADGRPGDCFIPRISHRCEDCGAHERDRHQVWPKTGANRRLRPRRGSQRGIGRNRSLGLWRETIVCAAHRLQNAIRHGLNASPAVVKLLALSRKMVGHFKHSALATNALNAKQREMQPRSEPKKVAQDVPTHRNTSYQWQSVASPDVVVKPEEQHNEAPALPVL